MTNIAVFISGTGTTLKRIIDACNNGEITSKVNLVISSNETCKGVKIAQEEKIKVISTQNVLEILEVLESKKIDFIVLAGYLKLLPWEIIKKYPQKIINIHPALLPNFGGLGMYGMKVHEAVIATKQKISGATVHYVDKNFDTGKIIDQWIVEVKDSETPESLNEKVQKVEKELLIRVLKNLNNQN